MVLRSYLGSVGFSIQEFMMKVHVPILSTSALNGSKMGTVWVQVFFYVGTWTLGVAVAHERGIHA